MAALPAHPQASQLQEGGVPLGGPCDLVLGTLGPGRASRSLLMLLAAQPARAQAHAHRVWTWMVSWYSRSNMHIFRSTMDLGTQTGTSTATPMARKCN